MGLLLSLDKSMMMCSFSFFSSSSRLLLFFSFFEEASLSNSLCCVRTSILTFGNAARIEGSMISTSPSSSELKQIIVSSLLLFVVALLFVLDFEK